ncbi:MAG: hypothetical protein ACK5JT_10520 [Hyphomicrobiaceae bacterium]
MRGRFSATAVALALGLAVSVSSAHAASCVDKGGKGTGGTVASAKFQAWEAVLQATDWSMWFAWITTNTKVGQAAAGYRVSHYREKCYKGGSLGRECIIRAKLCR